MDKAALAIARKSQIPVLETFLSNLPIPFGAWWATARVLARECYYEHPDHAPMLYDLVEQETGYDCTLYRAVPAYKGNWLLDFFLRPPGGWKGPS